MLVGKNRNVVFLTPWKSKKQYREARSRSEKKNQKKRAPKVHDNARVAGDGSGNVEAAGRPTPAKRCCGVEDTEALGESLLSRREGESLLSDWGIMNGSRTRGVLFSILAVGVCGVTGSDARKLIGAADFCSAFKILTSSLGSKKETNSFDNDDLSIR